MGTSVVDYAIANADTEEEILAVDEGKREESDHLPIIVIVKSSEIKNNKLFKEKEEARVMVKSVWADEV